MYNQNNRQRKLVKMNMSEHLQFNTVLHLCSSEAFQLRISPLCWEVSSWT